MSLYLKWKRPTSVEYPKVWTTFQEKDLNNDKMVEYRIQDLPESMFEKAIQYMIDNFIRDEPVSNFYNGANDPDHMDDYARLWRTIPPQKTILVCLKTDSDDIVGINFNYVLTKNDTFLSDIAKISKSKITHYKMKIFAILYKNLDVFKKYGTDQFLGAFGLSVVPEYRGRRIGERLLKARKLFAEKFDLKLTHNLFSSDFSNKIADNVGFKLDVGYTYDEIEKIDPTIKIKDINCKEVTLKTWVF